MKVLILRFSSFGDVTQCLSVPSKIRQVYPMAEIHWAVRSDLAELLEGHPSIQRIWSLSRSQGLKGLLELGALLRQQNFTHVYDAHNNLRSFILGQLVMPFWKRRKSNFILKSQKRWKRFLLFRLRINKYQVPFSGQRDLLEPLLAWNINSEKPPVPQLFLNASQTEKTKVIVGNFYSLQKGFIALAPSAAFALKRWPLRHWRELIQRLPNEMFLLLGGPEDLFLDELATEFPDRVKNMAGRCSLMESAALVQLSKAIVTNDTGLLHVAEQLGHPAIALMGPAPFGFPSRPRTRILELDLACRPCSKHGQGPCINTKYQHCLVGIEPQTVVSHLERILG